MGDCSAAEVAVRGTSSSVTVALQLLSSTLLSWPSSWEKLDRWLVLLVTTLIKQVFVGPEGGGGGAEGGIGITVVDAAQRAVARDAW